MITSTTQERCLKIAFKSNKIKFVTCVLAMGLIVCLSCEALAALDLDKAQKALTRPLLEFIHNHGGKFILAAGAVSLIVAEDKHIAKLNPFKRKTIKKSQEERKE
jgi:hypothetical protein